MWKVLATSMRCLHCGKKLSLLRKFSDGEFCSAEHRQVFQQQQSDLALARLLEAREKIEEPVAALIPAVRGVVSAEEKGKPARLPEPAARQEADDLLAPLYEQAFPEWPAAVQRAWMLRYYDLPLDSAFPAEYPAAGLKINISRFGVAGLSALNEEFIPTPASRLPKNGVSAIPFAGAFALPPHEAGTPPEFLLSEAGLVPVAYAGPVNRPLCILANEFDAIACPQGAMALPNLVPVADIPDFDAMLAAALPVDAEEDIAAQVVFEPESPAEPEAPAEPVPGLVEELRPILLAGAIARQFRRMEVERAEQSIQLGLAIPAFLARQEEARITRAFHSHPLLFDSRPAAPALSCRTLEEKAQIEFVSAPSAMPSLTPFRREPAPAMSFAEAALDYPTARVSSATAIPALAPARWMQSEFAVPEAPAAAIRINGGRMAKPKDQRCLPVYEPLPAGMACTVRAEGYPAVFGNPVAPFLPVAAPNAESYRLPEPEPVRSPERPAVEESMPAPVERPRRLRAAGQPKPAIDLRAAMGFRTQDKPVAEPQPDLEAPIAPPVAPLVADEPAQSQQISVGGEDSSAPPLFAKLVPTPTLRGCGGKAPAPRCNSEAVWTDSFDRAPFLPRPKFAVLSAEPAAEERRSAFSSISDKLHPFTTLSRSNRFWKYAPADLKWISLAIPIILVVVIYSFKPSPSKVTAGPSVATTATSESSTLLGSQLASVKNVIMERAAVKLFDDFRGGLSSWQGEEGWSKTWKYDQSSFLEPGKLALYTPTVRMSDYRFSFLGQIDTRSLNWVFRAKDEKNYYAMRIVITKPGPLPSADVVRYAVIDGKEVQRKSFPLPFSIRQDTLYQVEMDVRGNQFTTYLQGQIVDSFTDDRFAQGGVGFFTPKGDRSLLRWVEVTYQYDYLGRLCAMLAPYSAHAEGRRVE